jgi:hypothetical protein
LRLTACLNLPAPGRSQSVYVGLDNALARSCVFAKQSLGTILCGQLLLPLYEVTYHWHPLSRSYGVILPSSFSVNHSSPLGCSPRPPVSDCGTVDNSPGPRSFSRQYASATLFGLSEDSPFGIGSRLSRRICLPGNVYHLGAGHPTPASDLTSASLLRLVTAYSWYGNVDPFPIVYASRPRLRDRLTLS